VVDHVHGESQTYHRDVNCQMWVVISNWKPFWVHLVVLTCDLGMHISRGLKFDFPWRQIWLASLASSNKIALDAKVDVHAHISEMTHIPKTLRLSMKMWC